jgi:hypothetical protein
MTLHFSRTNELALTDYTRDRAWPLSYWGSRRSVAALVREAIRKVVLMPAAESPIAIWDGEPKRSSPDHDSVHDEP